MVPNYLCAGSVRSRAFLPHLSEIQALAEGETVPGQLMWLPSAHAVPPGLLRWRCACWCVCGQLPGLP